MCPHILYVTRYFGLFLFVFFVPRNLMQLKNCKRRKIRLGNDACLPCHSFILGYELSAIKYYHTISQGKITILNVLWTKLQNIQYGTFSSRVINHYSCYDNSSIKQNQSNDNNLVCLMMKEISDFLPYRSYWSTRK